MVSEPNSRSTMASSLQTLFNILNHLSFHMECKTYLCWKSQFEDISDIHDLKSCIFSSKFQPEIKLSDGTKNLDFVLWKKTDKLVLSWIKATISPSVQTLIPSCSRSFEAWQLLEKILSPVFKTHIRSTWDQLCSLKKASDQSIVDYLLYS